MIWLFETGFILGFTLSQLSHILSTIPVERHIWLPHSERIVWFVALWFIFPLVCYKWDQYIMFLIFPFFVGTDDLSKNPANWRALKTNRQALMTTLPVTVPKEWNITSLSQKSVLIIAWSYLAIFWILLLYIMDMFHSVHKYLHFAG